MAPAAQTPLIRNGAVLLMEKVSSDFLPSSKVFMAQAAVRLRPNGANKNAGTPAE
jgi:hypothetical protein